MIIYQPTVKSNVLSNISQTN